MLNIIFFFYFKNAHVLKCIEKPRSWNIGEDSFNSDPQVYCSRTWEFEFFWKTLHLFKVYNKASLLRGQEKKQWQIKQVLHLMKPNKNSSFISLVHLAAKKPVALQLTKQRRMRCHHVLGRKWKSVIARGSVLNHDKTVAALLTVIIDVVNTQKRKQFHGALSWARESLKKPI